MLQSRYWIHYVDICRIPSISPIIFAISEYWSCNMKLQPFTTLVFSKTLQYILFMKISLISSSQYMQFNFGCNLRMNKNINFHTKISHNYVDVAIYCFFCYLPLLTPCRLIILPISLLSGMTASVVKVKTVVHTCLCLLVPQSRLTLNPFPKSL